MAGYNINYTASLDEHHRLSPGNIPSTHNNAFPALDI
jgi:hypothetical protein